MEIEIRRTDTKFQFESTHKDLDIRVTASPQLAGDQATGVRPTELLLSALGSCMSIDVLLVLYKQRQKVDDFRVQVHGHRSDSVPAVFTRIDLLFLVEGQVDEAKLERAISLSKDTYCTVRQMLNPAIEVHTSHKITHA